MKRYTQHELEKEEIIQLLSRIGEVIEVAGYTARIVIDARLMEVQLYDWREFKEE